MRIRRSGADPQMNSIAATDRAGREIERTSFKSKGKKGGGGDIRKTIRQKRHARRTQQRASPIEALRVLLLRLLLAEREPAEGREEHAKAGLEVEDRAPGRAALGEDPAEDEPEDEPDGLPRAEHAERLVAPRPRREVRREQPDPRGRVRGGAEPEQRDEDDEGGVVGREGGRDAPVEGTRCQLG